MITVKCKYCGAPADIDEKNQESVVCRSCKKIITLEEAAPEKYKELIEKREKTEQRYKNILKDYEGGNDAPLKNAMHKVISNTDNEDFNINRWFDFIFDAVNIGIKKNDITNLEIFKAHARKFDDTFSDYNAGDRRLYNDLVFLHPEILNEGEWKVEFEKAKSNKSDLMLLQNNIIKCVKERKDPKLLVNIVSMLSNFAEDFKHVGEDFLNSILDDEEIANILSIQFFKKARGRNFAKKLRAYVSGTFKDSEVILKDTLVWNNAEKVQKARKNKAIIIVSSILGAIAIAATVILLYLNSADKDTTELKKGNPIVKMVYNENPDLTGYTVVFTKKDGTVEEVPVTPDMLSGYDKEKIGIQDAKVTYNGKTFDIKIEVTASKLQKTVVTIQDNKLIWERVANAEGYHIYLSKNSGAVGESKYATLEDKAGNATLVFDLASISNMGTTFYANIVAYSTSDKYSDSDKSDEVTVTKLSAPSGVVYNKDTGKLTWDPITGADHYEITLNGETIRNVVGNEQALTLKLGDNDITVTAFPTEQDVIMSVSSVKIHKLSPVQSIAYVNNKITWTVDSQSNVYNIYRDGEPVATAHSGKAFDVASWEEGAYTVKIEVASPSSDKVTSEPFECKVHVGTVIATAGGEINWSALGGNSYDVYVDGEKFSGDYMLKSMTISEFNFTVGEHKIYIVVKDDSSISETITIRKLASPTLSIVNQALKVTGLTLGYQFSVDTVPFEGAYTGIIATLTEAREYVISAVNKAANDKEIDSEPATLTVKRLEAPIISVVNGELYAGNTPAVSWYVNNIPKEPSLITAGTHTVYAMAIASADNELNSVKSNELTVTKLPTPVLRYEKTPERKLICTPETATGGEIKYYKNGDEWVVNLNELSGVNDITARFVSNTDNYLNSEISNMVSVVTTNAKLDINTSGTSGGTVTQITARLKEGEAGLSYRVEVKWFNGESEIDSSDYGKKTYNAGGQNNQAIPTVRAGQTATKIEVTVRIYASDGSETDVLVKTWTR